MSLIKDARMPAAAFTKLLIANCSSQGKRSKKKALRMTPKIEPML